MPGAQPGDIPRDKAHPKGSKGPRPEPASMIAGGFHLPFRLEYLIKNGGDNIADELHGGPGLAQGMNLMKLLFRKGARDVWDEACFFARGVPQTHFRMSAEAHR